MSKKSVPFEGRMSYRGNGAIKISSSDEDLAGFFLTLKHGTESYASAYEFLQANGVKCANEQRVRTRGEVEEHLTRRMEQVLLGFDLKDRPVYWDGAASPLLIEGRDGGAAAARIYNDLPSARTKMSHDRRDPEALTNRLAVHRDEAIARLVNGKKSLPVTIFLEDFFATAKDSSALYQTVRALKELKINFVMLEPRFYDEGDVETLLLSTVSTLYVGGARTYSPAEWASLPMNAAYWKPYGASEAQLINLV